MAQQSDFQKAFLAKGTGQQLFTRNEVDAEIDGVIKSFELMAREYIMKERDACAKIAHDMEKARHEAVGDPNAGAFTTSAIARAILLRGEPKNDSAKPAVSAVSQ